MRRIYLLLCLLLPLFAHAQITYHRYLDSTSTWFEWQNAYVFSGPNCTLGGDIETYYRNHIVGWDSLDGQAWYLVHQDWASTQTCVAQPPVYNVGQTISPLSYRIREDSASRIWRKEGNLPEILRYDFQPGLGIADTLWMEDRTVPCAIAQIDTVYLGSTPRKRYWCDCSQPGNPQFVVEGVGYNRGFDALWSFCSALIDFDYSLVCYHQGGDSIILDTVHQCGTPDHNPQVGIADAVLPALSVHWLEADQALALDLPAHLVGLQWAVHDPSGRRLAQGANPGDHIVLPGLPAGIYLFVGQHAQGSFTKRFLRP